MSQNQMDQDITYKNTKVSLDSMNNAQVLDAWNGLSMKGFDRMKSTDPTVRAIRDEMEERGL